MLLLVGLGNPGPRYAGHRHNVGFMAVDEIVRRRVFSPWRTRFNGEVAEGHLGGERTLILKPMTFMNESSKAVGEAVRFLKIPLDRVVVFHDELDLAPGRIRMKKGGGAGGHNGLRDIDAHVGKDYRRVRIGIGHPGHKDLVLHWVLRDFEPDERDPKDGWLPKVLGALADESALLAEGGAKADERYMSRVAHLAPPPKPPSRRVESVKMGFNCGIVGLPNVGKSTLFNALTATQAAQAANYPFCTIEPNVGRVAVPDPRLDKLAGHRELGQDHQHPARVRRHRRPGEGRVARAKGLGNQFLANIREVDAIAHVLRCFEDCDVTHVSGGVDPVRDAEIVETELMLADLDSLEKRLPNLEKRAKGGDKEAAAEAPVVKKALDGPARRQARARGRLTDEERPVFARPAAHHRQADDVRAERRGGLGRHRQRP